MKYEPIDDKRPDKRLDEHQGRSGQKPPRHERRRRRRGCEELPRTPLRSDDNTAKQERVKHHEDGMDDRHALVVGAEDPLMVKQRQQQNGHSHRHRRRACQQRAVAGEHLPGHGFGY